MEPSHGDATGDTLAQLNAIDAGTNLNVGGSILSARMAQVATHLASYRGPPDN